MCFLVVHGGSSEIRGPLGKRGRAEGEKAGQCLDTSLPVWSANLGPFSSFPFYVRHSPENVLEYQCEGTAFCCLWRMEVKKILLYLWHECAGRDTSYLLLAEGRFCLLASSFYKDEWFWGRHKLWSSVQALEWTEGLRGLISVGITNVFQAFISTGACNTFESSTAWP